MGQFPLFKIPFSSKTIENLRKTMFSITCWVLPGAVGSPKSCLIASMITKEMFYTAVELQYEGRMKSNVPYPLTRELMDSSNSVWSHSNRYSRCYVLKLVSVSGTLLLPISSIFKVQWNKKNYSFYIFPVQAGCKTRINFQIWEF